MSEAPLILAASHWGTNARLMLDVERLGYLPPPVCDLTYGRGLFWTALGWRPGGDLVAHSGDLRASGLPGRSFGAAVLDPPYVSMGGRATSGLPDFMDRYGLAEAARSPRLLQEGLINPGLAEAARISNRYVLIKVKDYVSSGKLWRGIHETRLHADSLGLTEVDHFIFLTGAGSQPPGRRQVHARRNYSMLLVFEIPRLPPVSDGASIDLDG